MTFRPIAMIALALAVGFGATSASAEYQAALDAYAAGDFEKAFNEWLAPAEDGDPRAQYGLGIMYRNGEWVDEDAAKAAEWLTKSADQGFAGAQFNLGVMYQKGAGVEQDDARAAELYETAARQGMAMAQYNLAVLHQLGMGVDRDLVEAYVWFTMAGLQGNMPGATASDRISVGLTGNERDRGITKIRELLGQPTLP
ncbi:MAG: sel1 repeat family protein [Alphaproteobacteria bacterium]|nr:sel1 repeat family protein [Alphaproteobacteria bacterium]MBT5861143.1 sel1 repeat family protein [Alphaproteobacteria bacterium]